MAIAGAAFMPMIFVTVLVWRDLNVKKIAQTKGHVF